MIKRIAAIITLILVVGLGVFLCSVNKREQEQALKYEEMDDARRPLTVKKQQIEQQLVELKDAYEADKMSKGTTQVIFTGLEEEIFSVCYPIMQQFEYMGTLAISLTQLPGMEGLMTVEQFQQLIDEGWDICVKWDSQTPVNHWWKELQNKMQQLGLESCSVVYFTAGTYKSSLDASLQAMGFTIVVHHGEESDSLIQQNEEEGLWHLGAVGLMGEKPKLRLNEAIAQKGNITYLVGFELEDEMYNERSFRSMLSYFDTYEANKELKVLNIEDARQHYRERVGIHDQEKENEYEKEKARLEEELAVIEEELSKLKVR